MTKIKKAYLPIYELLEANQDALVADILPQVVELASAKVGAGGGKASTFHKIEDRVVAIFCYYHKKWMNPEVVAFGAKATSPTGLNNMCKDGANKWSKQNREAKLAEAELLNRVTAGELDVADIPAEQDRIKEESKRIVPFEGEAFDTLEELLEHYGL